MEDEIKYCDTEEELTFNLFDEDGNSISLLQELKRMRYINVINSEIQSILSGQLSSYALKKLQVLRYNYIL